MPRDNWEAQGDRRPPIVPAAAWASTALLVIRWSLPIGSSVLAVMKQIGALGIVVMLAAVAAGSSSAEPRAVCLAARVNYTACGGGDHSLDRAAWVGGALGRYRLRGLLWYWPGRWRSQYGARADLPPR